MESINKDINTLYEQAVSMLEVGCPSVMNARRSEAIESFNALGGVPHRTEDYMYLDLKPLFAKDYAVSLQDLPSEIKAEELYRCDVDGLDCITVLTLNGHCVSSNQSNILEGVVICSMRDAGKKYPELFEKYYDKLTKQSTRDGLIPLNTAMAQDGVFVYVPKNVVLKQSVQIVNLVQSRKDLMYYQRNLVIVDKNSQASILVCDHTLSNQLFLANNATEIVAEENAYVDYYQVQNRHLGASQINSLFVDQHQNSTFNSYTVTLYGGIIRNNFYVAMGEKGCTSNLYGIYTLDKNQRVDNFTYVDHIAPECTSNQIFKGILDDASLANFCGQVRVRSDAQKTESNQLNRNLLLTDKARVNSKPQLVIDADDVKCNHGASVGQIDEEALFYLRSRGIGLEEARMMMMFGFAHDIISRVKLEPLREKIDELVDKRLRGELSKCHHCMMGCNKTV